MQQQTGSTNIPSVFVFGLNVDQQAVREFAINLVEWSQNNPGRPLRINLNSTGGSILDALCLRQEFQRLRALGHHLTIAVYGRAASCSSWLVQAADWRIIGDQSWLLIHEASSRADGTITAIRNELERLVQLQDQTIDILTSRTQGALTAKMIHDHVDGGRDWWITAKDAKELGLVDEVEEPVAFKGNRA
jgi:ATP-dependent Clp protease protease subunit